MSPRLLFVCLCLLLCTFIKLQAQTKTVQVTVLNGTERRCIADSIVEIQITPNQSLDLKEISLDWGDGTAPVSIVKGEPLILKHKYNTSKYLKECTYKCITSDLCGFSLPISVFAGYSNGEPENVGKSITYQMPPRPAILINTNNVVCTGNEIAFNNQTCPSNDQKMEYLWDFGDGNTSTERSPKYTYLDLGNKTVKLTAKNACGTVTIEEPIRVLGEPLAVARVDSGAIEVGPDRYVVCLSRGSIVRLASTGTLNTSLYNWTVSGPGRTNWVNNSNRRATSRLDIFEPGVYTVTLTSDNACNKPNTKTLTIEAKSAEALLPFKPQEDGCISLNYTPNPLNLKATYTINGISVAAANFPSTLPATPAPYIVESTLNNECGNQMRMDTFFVLQPEPVAISFPGKDTTVCEKTTAIPLRAGPIGGNWVGSNLSRQGFATSFTPSAPGVFPLIYVRGNGNCERRDTIKVTVEENIKLSIKPQTDECLDFSYTPIPLIANARYSLNGNPRSNFPVPITVSTNRDVYNVVATFENTCGKQEARDTFVVTGALPVGITQPLLPTTQLCAGDSARTLAALPLGGTFKGSNVIKLGNGFAFDPVSSGTFPIVYVRGDGSCERSDTATFVVNARVVLSLSTQTDECNLIRYTPSPIIPGAQYTVNGVRATNFPLDLGSSNTPYVVEATLTDVCGTQIKRDTFFVRTPSPLKITIPGRDTSVCQNSAVFPISVSALGGTWQNSKFINSTPGGFTFTPSEAGSFKMVYRDGSGTCAQQDSVVIDVQQVSLDAQGVDVCFNTATQLKGLPLGGTWSSTECPGCITGSSFDARLLSTPRDSVQVVYTVLNAIGCNSTDAAYVRITRPQAGFKAQGNICSNGLVQIDLTGTKAERSRWLLGNIPLDPPPFQFIPEGEQRITQIAFIGACSDTLSQQFTVVAPPPPASFTPSALEGCPPLKVSFKPDAAQRNGLSYSWNFGRTTSDSLSKYLPDSSYVYANDTSIFLRYKVTLSIKNQCGSTTDQNEITIFPLPVAQIGLDSLSNQCSPVIATITNRSTGFPDACVWDFDNGVIDTTCRDIYVQNYGADTTTIVYLIKLQVKNVCGVSNDTFPLTVTSPGVRAFFNLDDFNVCPNKPIKFNDASAPLPRRVFWKFGDGGVSQERNPTYVYRIPDTTLTVTLVAITGCGYDSLSRKIYVQPLPDVNFATDRYACQLQATTFINRSNEQAAFRWDFGDGTIDSVTYSPQHIFQKGGLSTNVSLTIKDFPNGCENTITKPLLIRSKPEANFSINGDSTGCAPFTVIFQNLSRNSNRWEWDFGDGKTSTLENPGTVYDTGAYDIKLIASYEGICSDTLFLFDAITADDCGVFIPNAFSPNGDGLNDFFSIYGGPLSATKILTFRIYTRWGEMVFQRENFNMDNLSGWDGRIDGQVPIPGVYVYWIEIEQLGGRRKQYKGDVTLVR